MAGDHFYTSDVDREFNKDIEKEPNPKVAGIGNMHHDQARKLSYVDADGAVPGESFEIGDSWYAKAQRFAGKMKIEQRGIERVPEYERDDNSLLNVGSMWLAANMVISSFAIGVLGQSIFALGFVPCFLTILFFNLLGIMPVCFFSTFGPAFGLRQMILSRFWFGWHGVKVIAFFNTLACIGWSSVNVIVGAQLIHAVNHNVPGWAGILIIAFCTFFVTLFGYKVVHLYEYWSWIPTFIIFMIVLGVFAHSGDFQNTPWGDTGATEAGDVLSFGAIIFGFATGWTSYAADYTVYQPSNRSKKMIFFATWIGLIIPLLFTEMLGAAVITAASPYPLTQPKIPDGPLPNRFAVAYSESGSGGLLAEVLVPHTGNFGNFCLVILALSIIANNCPNIYSVALTVQVFGRWTQRIPRFVWTLIATGVYIGISIPGYTHFQLVLEYFMNFIGYWLAIYEGISLMEHFVFKKGFSGYHAENYDYPEKLPPGLAAIGAFCVGIAGVVLGMSQPQWFVGPIAERIGEYTGDIGFELGFSFAAVGYLAFRPLELRFFGR